MVDARVVNSLTVPLDNAFMSSFYNLYSYLFKSYTVLRLRLSGLIPAENSFF